jgi:hypothetical protein
MNDKTKDGLTYGSTHEGSCCHMIGRWAAEQI